MTDARWGQHPGHTRVVLEFAGEGHPQFEVGYDELPTEPDYAVDINGSVFPSLVAYPAAGHDCTNPDCPATFDDGDQISVGSGPVVEMALGEEFESYYTWWVGLIKEKGFHAFVMTNPTRVVIDIGNCRDDRPRRRPPRRGSQAR